jgi:valyl-tRNA synthetase
MSENTPNEMPTAYEPHEVEQHWYPLWEKNGDFAAKGGDSRPPYSIVVPPPNVTGSLHMGHALNATLQDLLSRYHRMRGYNVLWLPGCDHAGIATQNVVEKQLKKEGKSRHDLGREGFVHRVWDWKNQYGATIMKQFRAMGSSMDWSRERFTMDEGLSRSVRRVFVELYNEGLIYQDYYLINWCPRCQTALSDIEVEHKTVQGAFYHLRYYYAHDPSNCLEVATTRPETLLGDTAVAVHPGDVRYAGLAGKSVILPLLNKEIPIIEDGYVDKDFGTGVVKITPAHDFNDFQVGNRHKLPRINILNPDGTLNENAGPYKNMDRFEARKRIVADLDERGLLIKVESHEHNVGHCYRCGTVVEPYYSKQWFVKMKPLAEEALKAVADGRTKFTPESWREEYNRWLNNIQDWCISRQIWWGHRIPVYTCGDCKKVFASEAEPTACPSCGGKHLTQDPDVLDTWFSSALWPFSTLGWPDSTADLKTFYPTSVLVTSWDILFFWVARMMMMGLKFMGEVPFKEVYIYSLVADEDGKKMSKSKGNVIDPLQMVDKYGADALRFTLASIETKQRYVALTTQKLESSRNYVNKLYNAVRFTLISIGANAPEALKAGEEATAGLALEDQWILHRLGEVSKSVADDIERYRPSDACTTLYLFLWNEVCDWYLEAIKPRLLSGTDSSSRGAAAKTILCVVESILKLLHPFTPYVTEELWHRLPGKRDYIMRSPWPIPDSLPKGSEEDAKEFAFVQETVTSIRTSRAELNVPPSARVKIMMPAPLHERLSKHAALLRTLARVDSLEVSAVRPPRSAMGKIGDEEIWIPLEGLIDLSTEGARQAKELEKAKAYLKALELKMANEAFVKNAPAGLIDAEKAKITLTMDRIARLENTLTALAG